MKKQYRNEKKTTEPVKSEPKPNVVELPKEIKSKQSIISTIKNDGMFPLIIMIFLFTIITIGFGLWITHYELDENITIKLDTTSAGAYITDECGNIYEISPIGFDKIFNHSEYYRMDIIKYPNYNFGQSNPRKVMNYHLINESEYKKMC